MAKQKKQKCIGCRNKVVGRKECSTCRMKRLRAADPLKAAYTNLKYNAGRRKHTFTLTLDEFRAFCIATDYIAGKGRTKDSFSVDRIDPTKGYEADNLQVLTVSENAKKSNKLVYDWQTKTALVFKSDNFTQTGGPF